MIESDAPSCTIRPVTQERRYGWFPVLASLKNYRWQQFSADTFAGIALSAMLVPVGMGYAQASGLPAIYGLYATISALIAYAVFGPSRILIVGPDSALSALIAAAILPLAGDNVGHSIALAGMLAILSGLLCFTGGIARFGFLTDLLSMPIRYGYMNGVAVIVIISQLPGALGVKSKADGVFSRAFEIVSMIANGDANGAVVIISVLCLSVLLAFKRWMPRFPAVLVVVAVATFLVTHFGLAHRFDVEVVGTLPQGLPNFSFPTVSFAELSTLVPAAIAISFVSFADTIVLSRTFAHRKGQTVDANQELRAIGIVNIVCGLFQGFPISGSQSRTPVAESAGAQTQLAGLVGAIAIALLLLFAPALLKSMPIAALSAIVIGACVGLIQVAAVQRMYSLRRSELINSLVCFLGVMVLGVIPGIFFAVTLAMLEFIWRAWRPYDAILGRIDSRKGYHDISRHPEAKCIPGLVLYRWDAPLFFANAALFQERLLRAASVASTPTRRVVVTAEPMTDVDLTAADMLKDLHKTLAACGIELGFAELKGPVKDRLKRYGLFDLVGSDHFYPTIGLAVDDHVRSHRVDWRDWDEGPLTNPS